MQPNSIQLKLSLKAWVLSLLLDDLRFILFYFFTYYHLMPWEIINMFFMRNNPFPLDYGSG